MILLVTKSMETADRLIRSGLSPHIKAVGVGYMLNGYGFDTILAHDSLAAIPWQMHDKAREWWDESVRCRLYPGGYIDPNPWAE